jgi:hypothetical protein
VRACMQPALHALQRTSLPAPPSPPLDPSSPSLPHANLPHAPHTRTHAHAHACVRRDKDAAKDIQCVLEYTTLRNITSKIEIWCATGGGV